MPRSRHAPARPRGALPTAPSPPRRPQRTGDGGEVGAGQQIELPGLFLPAVELTLLAAHLSPPGRPLRGRLRACELRGRPARSTRPRGGTAHGHGGKGKGRVVVEPAGFAAGMMAKVSTFRQQMPSR